MTKAKLLARIAALEAENEQLRSQLQAFNPDMLSIARDIRSLTNHSLAVQTKMSVGRVSKIVHGIAVPTRHEIARFSAVLHFPVAHFHCPGQRSSANRWMD